MLESTLQVFCDVGIRNEVFDSGEDRKLMIAEFNGWAAFIWNFVFG